MNIPEILAVADTLEWWAGIPSQRQAAPLLPPIPEGYVLAPREPTHAMNHAAMSVADGLSREARSAIYRAMLAAVPPMDKAEGVKLWRCPTCKESGRTCECRPEPLAPEAGEVVGVARLDEDDLLRVSWLLPVAPGTKLFARPSPAALRVADELERLANRLALVDASPRLRALAKQLRGGK